MITNISTGDYNVIESNVVYLYKHDMDLILDFEFGSFKFKIVIVFADDTNTKEERISREVSSDTVKFTCINFKNNFGTGTTKPIEIATIDNKKLYIHLWSFVLGNIEAEMIARKVEYTVFAER